MLLMKSIRRLFCAFFCSSCGIITLDLFRNNEVARTLNVKDDG
jgi:hypothetical protein